MFILYVQQVVPGEAFKQQGSKDGVCFYIHCFLYIYVCYSLLLISHMCIRTYVHYIYCACIQSCVCNMPCTCVYRVSSLMKQSGSKELQMG